MKASILFRWVMFWSWVLSPLGVAAETSKISGLLEVTATPWSAQCQPLVDLRPAQCGLPAAIPGSQAQSFSMELGQVAQPGEVAVAQHPFSGGLITVYSVMPQVSENLPPYLQIQIELTGSGRAVCMESVKWTGVGALPPLICAGLTSAVPQTEVGLTTQLYISATSPSI